MCPQFYVLNAATFVTSLISLHHVNSYEDILWVKKETVVAKGQDCDKAPLIL
jgi:hypothetical protein